MLLEAFQIVINILEPKGTVTTVTTVTNRIQTLIPIPDFQMSSQQRQQLRGFPMKTATLSSDSPDKIQ